VKCHGEGKLEGGLDLRRRFLLLKGGDSGAALVEGKPEQSLLIEKISKGEMPPKEEGKLDDKQLDLIRRWVASGAPIAGDKELPLETAEPPSRITAEDRKFWSFVPPVRPSLPVLKNADRARSAIDVYLLARLEPKQLSYAPDAPKKVLLRRATFTLHGLPPEIAELDAFLADGSPDAYERLLDRLQASPRYGEHAARQWLDVAGYADSDGYLAADRLRPQAWRYRDYVIGALNSDLPYGRFLLEQLAGDELSDWRRAEELSPEQARQLAATGFLRTASDPTYPGYTEPNEIHQVMADTTQIVSSSLLGLTIQCARCHSHKYDPIPHRDYYALQAILTPALDPARWQPSEVRGIPLATEVEQARITQHNQKIDGRVAELNAELAELTTRFRKKRVTELMGAEGKDAALVAKLTAALLAAADKRNGEQKELVAKFAVGVSLAEADLAKWNGDYQQQSDKLKAVIAGEAALKQQIVTLRGLIDMDDKPADCKLLLRGDYNKPGAVIPPNVPEVLAPVAFKLEPKPGYKTTGRREAFARWLIEPNHPLTARVQVNRVWARQFGRGIVPTLANFGRSGVKPTHPELLDYLATEFIQQGWGQKKLVRQFLSSTAWRQSSTPNAATLAADPNNELLGYWRATRHSGEMLRDSTLAAAGKLNGTMFGSPSAVAQQGDGSVITADDAAGNRRSIYLIVRRSQHVTMLDLFDVPMMEVNCPQRSASIVPLQALAMLHGPFSEQSAAALADRILRETATDDARIAFACRLLYSRSPRPAEKDALASFLAALTAEKLANASASPTDAQKSDATRAAWVQAALVLLNSNEFLYVH
ncbi:MAG: PSD1 and planctomycete cytochrome C domain-containing protein, partial [Planctomycetales bacterium]|nr:PSD1 and planctomycete cytochrome C domain-containing protein [Planctomycetales bacterium]